MQKLILSFIVVSTLLFGQTAVAQQFHAPTDYQFEGEEGYHKYDKDIIKFINWIQDKNVDQSSSNFKNAQLFFNEWLTGCPYVRYIENVRIEALFSEIPELKIYYKGGWVKYSLQNTPKTNAQMREFKLRCAVAGLESVIKEYKSDYQNSKRNGDIEDLIKVYNQGKMMSWVEDRM